MQVRPPHHARGIRFVGIVGAHCSAGKQFPDSAFVPFGWLWLLLDS